MCTLLFLPILQAFLLDVVDIRCRPSDISFLRFSGSVCKVKYSIDVCTYIHQIYVCADQEFTFDVSFKKLPSLPVFTSANLWHPSPCGIEQCHVIQYDMA